MPDLGDTSTRLHAPGGSRISRRRVLGTAAWSAPAIVAATGAPAFAASTAPEWSVSASTPSNGSSGNYPFSFTVTVTSGSIGTLTCEWISATGGFIGNNNTGTAFSGWTGAGQGGTSGQQRQSWLFTYGTAPVTSAVTPIHSVTMTAISASSDLPLTVRFAGSAPGASTKTFTLTSGGSNVIVVSGPTTP